MVSKKAKRSWHKKKGKSQDSSFSLVRFLLYWGMVALLWGSMAGVFLFLYFSIGLPDINQVHRALKQPSITLVDKEGNVIANYGRLYGSAVAYDEFPKHLVDAVVSTEDRRFFKHIGVDPLGLMRAMVVNYRADRIVQGGSTITQQLAKVSFLTPERTIKRKIQEMILALHLESKFSKEEIFTMYMNRIYFGAGCYGVGAAARTYFNKKVSELSLYESAMLAGLIKAPSRYSPTSHPKLAMKRADQVLMNMVDNEKLKPNELLTHQYGIDSSAVLAEGNDQEHTFYYSNWVKEQLPDYIGGLQKDIMVYTGFDGRLQRIAQDVLVKQIEANREAHKVTQGAVVIMTPDGAVQAIVGGVDHKISQFNRATQALRQPGSSFKLFVYLTALEKGWKPSDELLDGPLTIGNWSPTNWDNRYIGNVPLHMALSKSINTVAARLAQQVGISNVIKTAKRLGITTPIQNNMSTSLGSSEVTLIELTAAYAHLANKGRAVWTHGIDTIIDEDGKLVYRRANQVVTPEVIKPEVVGMMNDMLTEVVEEGTGKRARIDRMAAGKTGTSQNYRDAWFVGYTADYVIGVWVGNDDDSPMRFMAGGNAPAQIWHDIMVEINKGVEKKDLLTESTTAASRKRYEDDGKPSGFWSLWHGIFGGDSDKKEKELQPKDEQNGRQINRSHEFKNGVEIEYH